MSSPNCCRCHRKHLGADLRGGGSLEHGPQRWSKNEIWDSHHTWVPFGDCHDPRHGNQDIVIFSTWQNGTFWHARLCSTGGWGGLIAFWMTLRQGRRNMLPLMTCCTCSLMLNRGGGGSDNVLGDFKAGSTELVAVVDMLHMLAYDQQGGGGGGWQRSRRITILNLSHTGANRNGCPCCKNFGQVAQLPACGLLASKVSISNLQPVQGRRINRLPTF